MNPKKALAMYSAILLVIFTMAYLRYIPTELQEIPNYDSAGHFVLYGIWGWLFAKAFPRTAFRIGRFRIPTGICIIVPLAAIEESLQALSPARTFSLFDFFWGFLGIVLACILLYLAQSDAVSQ